MAASTVNQDGSVTTDDGAGNTITYKVVPDPNEGDQVFVQVTRGTAVVPEIARFKQYSGNRLAGRFVDVAGFDVAQPNGFVFTDHSTGYVTVPA